MHKALYRKYRPKDFESVIGQDNIIKTLKNSIKNNSFSHAYMFFGPRGVGKTTVSKIFARSVNCLNPIDGCACGKCENCIKSFEKECVDIIEIDAASNNGVDEIRDLRNKISLVPGELKYKVYIIDEVHMLSIGAFNALLKTLEEPPEHAIFILATTDPQKVPDTIISRCQCFNFNRISNKMIVERLKYVCNNEHICIDDDVLEEIAIVSDGGMRDSLSMLDELSSYKQEQITIDDFADLNGIVTKDTIKLFCDDIYNGNLASVYTKIDDFNSCGKNLIQIMIQVMQFFRNVVVDHYVNGTPTNYSIDKVLEFENIINEKMFDIKRSNDPKIYIEMLLTKCIKSIFGLQLNNNNISREINNNDVSKINDSIPSTKKNIDAKVEPVLNDFETNSDEEYDFFSDIGSDSFENEEGYDLSTENINKNIENSIDKNPESKCVSNDNSKGENDNRPFIINIEEINSIRINNIMATADKSCLIEEKEKFNMLNDFTFDQEIGYLVCNLLDGNIRAASKDGFILSYGYDALVKQNVHNLPELISAYNRITNSNKKIAILSDENWQKEKEKFIISLKNGNHYEVLEEPKEILEDIKNNDIINKAVELFGDIVEVKENKGE